MCVSTEIVPLGLVVGNFAFLGHPIFKTPIYPTVGGGGRHYIDSCIKSYIWLMTKSPKSITDS